MDAATEPLLPPDPAPEPEQPPVEHLYDDADKDGARQDADAPAVEEPDAPTCRICLAGREEAEELGRLIRPCLCRGTVAYVHVQCLNQWRKAAPGTQAFWECAQCHYKYQLVRTRALGIAQSPFVVGCSTLTLFTILVFTASIVFSIFLPSAWIDGSRSAVAKLVDESAANEYYYDNGYFSTYSPTAMANGLWKVAYQTLNDLFDDGLFPSAEEAEGDGDTSYSYKKEPRQPKEPRPAKDRREPSNVAPNGARTGPFKATIPVSKDKIPTERPTRLRKGDSERRYRKPGFLERLVRRFLLGLAIVGAFSFMTLSWSITMPLHWIRRRAGGRGRRDGDGDSLYAILAIAVLIIGVARALWVSYKVTNTIATALLKRAETAILEVGGDEPIPLEGDVFFPFTISLRDLRRVGTRQLWVDLWWSAARFARGSYEVVRDTIRETWRQLRWRDIVAVSLGLYAMYAGLYRGVLLGGLLGGGPFGGGGMLGNGGMWAWHVDFGGGIHRL